MPGGQDTCGYSALNQWWKLKQSQRVGYLRTGPTDPVCELFVCGAEVLQELLVRCCFFQRIQLAPMQVFQKGITEKVIVGSITDDRRDRFESRSLHCPPATFTHDQFIRFSTLFG